MTILFLIKCTSGRLPVDFRTVSSRLSVYLCYLKGSMNEITFRGDREKLSLADLKTMTIWHDGQGFMADWVLERICLTDCKTGKKFDFVFCEEYKFDKIKKNNRYFTIANGKKLTGNTSGYIF